MKRLDNRYQGYSNVTDGVRFIRDSRHAYGNRFQAEQSGGVFGLLIASIILAIALITIVLFPGFAQAQSVQIYDRETGQYLGNLNSNQLDPNSVSNPLGRYGNPLSPDSINNTLGKYGNPLSNSSVRNPFATNAPVLIAPQPNAWGR